jgi:hypothetical protein
MQFGSFPCNFADFHAKYGDNRCIDCCTSAEMSYFGKTPEFFSNCGVSVD